MTDPKTEALLRRFLDDDAKARSKGITIEALYAAVCKVAEDRLADRKAIADTLGRYGRRLRKVEIQLETVSEKPEFPDWRPDPREITGTHDLAVIKAAAKREFEHDDLMAKNTWWRENLGKTAFAVVAALVIASLSACITIAMQHTPIATPTPQAPK